MPKTRALSYKISLKRKKRIPIKLIRSDSSNEQQEWKNKEACLWIKKECSRHEPTERESQAAVDWLIIINKCLPKTSYLIWSSNNCKPRLQTNSASTAVINHQSLIIIRFATSCLGLSNQRHLHLHQLRIRSSRFGSGFFVSEVTLARWVEWKAAEDNVSWWQPKPQTVLRRVWLAWRDALK